MILDLVHIIRARHNKPLASKLALRFAQGQLFERATAPLLIVHLCLWTIVIIMAAIAAIIIASAIKVHGTIMIVALIPLAFCIISTLLSLRLKAGLDRIRTIAEGYSDSQIDRLFTQHMDDNPDLNLESPDVPSDTASDMRHIQS